MADNEKENVQLEVQKLKSNLITTLKCLLTPSILTLISLEKIKLK